MHGSMNIKDLYFASQTFVTVGTTAITYYKILRFFKVQYNARTPSSENTSIHNMEQAFRSQTINYLFPEVCYVEYMIHT
jgi:hypothetical protein